MGCEWDMNGILWDIMGYEWDMNGILWDISILRILASPIHES
jgi:hypothetical protein